MTDDADGSAGLRGDEAARVRLLRGQRGTVGLLFVGYAGYYLCRSNLSVCTPQILDELVAGGRDPESAKWWLGLLVTLGTLGYALGKFVGGGLADAIGGRRNFLGGMAGSVAFVLLFAAGGGLPVFTLAWVGNRLVQSFGWAGLVKITSRWFPFTRYGTVMGVLSLSFLFGDAASRRFMGLLIAQGVGWRGVFLVTACVLSGLLVLNTWLLSESPDRLGLPEPPANPTNVFGDTADGGGVLAPYLSLLRSPGFWLVCGLSFGLTLLRETFNAWTPTYFVEGVGLSKSHAADASALFPFAGGVSVLAVGWLSDRLGPLGRAAILSGGLALSGLALGALGLADLAGSVAWPVGLVTAVGFLIIGPYSFLAGAIALDFGGKAGSATASGLIDGVGYFGGALAGLGTAHLANRFGWHGAFLALAFVAWVSAFGAGLFLIDLHRASRAAALGGEPQ